MSSKKLKMVVMDLDGTLLDSNDHVPILTREKIAAANQCGILTVIATGRIRAEAQYAITDAGINSYFLEMNGAKVTDLRTEQLLVDEPLPQSVGDFVKALIEADLTFQVYTDRGVLCTADNKRRLPTSGISLHYLERFSDSIQEATFEEIIQGKIYKLLIIERDKQRLEKVRDLVKADPILQMVPSLPNYYEIIPTHIDKAHALGTLCQQLAISPEEILAIGDSQNDQKMLAFCGTGVVVANADETLKAQYHVVGSHDENGVAEAFDRFVLC